MIDADVDNLGAVAVWNVIFMDNPDQKWWDIFTRPGWRHCAAFGYSVQFDLWVVVDPANGLMRISVLDDQGLDLWRMARQHLTTTILRMPVSQSTRYRARLGHSCVTAMKQLLGLPCGAFTPQGLCRHMLANQAEIVRGDENVLRFIPPSRNEKSKSRPATRRKAS